MSCRFLNLTDADPLYRQGAIRPFPPPRVPGSGEPTGPRTAATKQSPPRFTDDYELRHELKDDMILIVNLWHTREYR